MSKLFVYAFFALLFGACRPSYTPKPKGYPRLDLPAQHYQWLPDTFPYRFAYSTHARMRPDSSWMAEPYWIALNYPDFSAAIFLTYKPIHQTPTRLYEYLSDTYRLVAKHQIKAYRIEERKLHLPSGIDASMVHLYGEVPTPLQFHATDSIHHFLRGALYFNTASKNDSLAPLIDYLSRDIQHLLNTLTWRSVP